MFQVLELFFSTRRSLGWKTVLLLVVIIAWGLVGSAYSENVNCPFNTGILQASASNSRTVSLSYTFLQPLTDKKGEDGEDDYDDDGLRGWQKWRGVATRERVVKCRWIVSAEHEDDHHTVWADVSLTGHRNGQDQDIPDCWTAYDGNSNSSTWLGKLCSGDAETQKRFESSGLSLFLVFAQGDITGSRTLQFHYKAESHAEDPVKRLAVISCSVTAALAVCFLGLKFSHCCRPCRIKWCPQYFPPSDDDDDDDDDKDEDVEGGGGRRRSREEEESARFMPRSEFVHLTPSAPSESPHLLARSESPHLSARSESPHLSPLAPSESPHLSPLASSESPHLTPSAPWAEREGGGGSEAFSPTWGRESGTSPTQPTRPPPAYEALFGNTDTDGGGGGPQ